VSDQPLLLSLSQAASLLGITDNQLYEICRTRSRVRQKHPIPTVRLGKRLAFRRESLERWITELETSAVQQ
jgi:predicted DNA-binding transcriptional regulator AlpA